MLRGNRSGDNTMKGYFMNNTSALIAAVLLPTQDQLDELNTLAHTGPFPQSESEAAALIRYLIDRITPPTDPPLLAADYDEPVYLMGF